MREICSVVMSCIVWCSDVVFFRQVAAAARGAVAHVAASLEDQIRQTATLSQRLTSAHAEAVAIVGLMGKPAEGSEEEPWGRGGGAGPAEMSSRGAADELGVEIQALGRLLEDMAAGGGGGEVGGWDGEKKIGWREKAKQKKAEEKLKAIAEAGV